MFVIVLQSYVFSVVMDKEKKKITVKLRKDIEYKVSVEKKAFEMTLELVGEDYVTEERLLESVPLLNPTNYSDIIEERFSMKLCGYILCRNVLEKIPKHKYHISVRTRQVFDLSERKMFCCDQCYKASNFFASQLSEEPLWKREDISTTEIKFLKITSGADIPKSPLQKDTNLNEDKVCKATEQKLTEVSTDATRFSQNRFTDLFHIPEPQTELEATYTSPLEECCNIVSTWLTNRTLNFLTKKADNRDFFDGIPIFPKLTDQLKEHLALRSCVNGSDSDDVMSDDSLSENDFRGCYPSSSAIDKMQAIYFKHTQTPSVPKGKLPDTNSLSTQSIPKIKEKELIESEVVLPQVDKYSQVDFRNKIVLEKLNRITPKVTRSLQLMPEEFWEDLTCLVRTFRLSPYNISLKPNQWVYVLIISIYFLSLVNSKVKASLEDERKLTEFNIPLVEQGEDPMLLKTIAVVHP